MAVSRRGGSSLAPEMGLFDNPSAVPSLRSVPVDHISNRRLAHPAKRSVRLREHLAVLLRGVTGSVRSPQS